LNRLAFLLVSALSISAGAIELRPESAFEKLLTGGPSPEALRASVERVGAHLGEAPGAGACVKCHPDVVEQWEASAHRFASFANPYYFASVELFRAERGPKASEFCGNCHDPMLVSTGRMAADAPIDRGSVEAQAGLTCMVCHSVEVPDLQGNGEGKAHITGPSPGPMHRQNVAKAPLRTALFCGGCHRVGLTEEVTADRWFRGQDEYGDWRDSGWAGRGAMAVWRPPEVRTCGDCHMPRVPAGPDEKGAIGGMIKSHRFAAANAALARLRDDPVQLAATAEALKGVVSMDLLDGGPGQVDVVMRNRKVGHRFPAGTVDSNEVWVELISLNSKGKVLRHSGAFDADGHLDPDAHRVRAQPVDEHGRPLARRDVQHQRGVVFDTRLPPGQARAARYALPQGTTRVKARLLYRKFSKDYAQFACAEIKDPVVHARCVDVPVLEVAAAEVALVDGRVPPTDDWALLVDHAVALSVGTEAMAAQAYAVAQRAVALAPPEKPQPGLALAMAADRLGRTDEVVAILDGVDALPDAPPARLWIRATALARAYRHKPALAAAEQLAALLPDDRHCWTLLARLRGLEGQPAAALEAAERALVGDREYEPALFQRSLALRDLGDRGADAAAALWHRHRRAQEVDLELRRKWRAWRGPGRPDPSEPVPTY
jgi:hypothetical protein